MSRRQLAILLATAVGTVSLGLAASVSPAAAKSPLNTCYFVVKIPEGSTTATIGPKLKKRISNCAIEMQDGTIRAAIRLGRNPTSTERAWQKAIIGEFVRNGCEVASGTVTGGCEVFAEEYPYGYAGKVAKPGTVIVFGFEPL